MTISSYDQPEVLQDEDGTKSKITENRDLQVTPQGGLQTSFYPDPTSVPSGDRTEAQYDSDNNLQVRAATFSDEGSVRLQFPSGPDTAITGTLTFVNGSTTVTGSGTSFVSQLSMGNYVRQSAQATSVATQIASIISDTEIELVEGYLGASVSGAAVQSKFNRTLTGSGAVTISSTNMNVETSGIGSALVCRQIDYQPISALFKMTVVHAHSTDVSKIGFTHYNFATHAFFIQVTGTSTSSFQFISQDSSGNQTVTEVVLRGAESLTSAQTYEIIYQDDSVILSVNGSTRAEHFIRIPGPYDVLSFCVDATSVNASGDINVSISETLIENYNVTQVTNKSSHPLAVKVVGSFSITNDTTGEGFAKGTASIASTTQSPVRKTVYTEQTSDAQRSVASASANDTAAGTGARTVRLTYYNSLGTGPFTEDLTLNGTTGVNTVNTNICYLDKVEVLTVGSGLTSAGIITLYAAINKGGATISTIAAGDVATSYAHHYISSGSTAKISSIFVGNSGDTSGKASRFVLKYQLLTANAAEKELSEVIRMPGGVAPVYRGLDTPILAPGPARLTIYVTNESSNAYDVFGSFSFTEA